MDALAPVSRPGVMPRRLLRLRSDRALAERFLGGDERAFALLYERHGKSVLAVCMGVLGSRHDAEDAAQEAFAALALSLRKAVPEHIPAWLTRVARNAAIDVARRRRSDTPADGALPDRAARAEGATAELESVMAGIRELPESQRTALLMRELAGHSYREIAALLELDEAAVHGLIARARISLRAYREAYEMSCAAARASLAAEPDGRRRDRTVRRHLRMCASCSAYQQALRSDARALHSLVPEPAFPLAGGGAVFGGLAAKGALLGGAVAQVTAACAVSVCVAGGIVLVAPHHVAARATAARASSGIGGGAAAAPPRRHVMTASDRSSAAHSASYVNVTSTTAGSGVVAGAAPKHHHWNAPGTRHSRRTGWHDHAASRSGRHARSGDNRRATEPKRAHASEHYVSEQFASERYAPEHHSAWRATASRPARWDGSKSR